MKSSYYIPIALALCSLLIMFDIQQAYALDLEIITPTGGNLTAGSDCGDIASGNGIIWHGCNNLIYAINDVTHAVLANISATTGTGQIMLASVIGTSLYHADGTDLTKYTYSSNTITTTGIYDPASCTIDAGSMIYDELGFIWFTCGVQDKVIRMNPNTFTTNMESQDLTDAIGLECDNPDLVSYSTTDDIGVIHCFTTNNYVTFSIASPTSITLLDDIVDGATEQFIGIHERYNRFFVGHNTGLAHYTYASTTGVITFVENLGLAGGYQDCHIEPYVSSDVFLMCADTGGGIYTIDIFFSDVTGFEQIANNAVSFAGGFPSIGFDIQDETWFLSSNVNNQQYIKISDVRAGETDPDPPSGGTGNNTNAVNGVCGNTDANGDGRVNVLDCVGGTTAWGGFTSGVPAVQVVGSITDGLGLTDCAEDGSDQDTCGSGLFFFILTLLLVEFLVLAGYLGLTSKLNADKEAIDVLLIMLIAGFAVLAIAFYLNWIPDLVFYSIIALIAGFLTFGLIAKIRGK